LCFSWGTTWVAIRLGVTAMPPLWFAATRFLAAGIVLLAIARKEGQRILRNPLPDRTSIWVSWAYLVIIGSMLGFTAYTYLLRTWGPTRTSAYAFITPVIALISGAAIAGESIGWEHVVGTALVLGAVAGVIRRPARSPSPAGKGREAAGRRFPRVPRSAANWLPGPRSGLDQQVSGIRGAQNRQDS
jgi:drug/metabolite transporter (DMT)-like permease